MLDHRAYDTFAVSLDNNLASFKSAVLAAGANYLGVSSVAAQKEIEKNLFLIMRAEVQCIPEEQRAHIASFLTRVQKKRGIV